MTEKARLIRQMALDHCAAWSRGDFEATTEIFASDGEISVNGAPPHRGHAELAATAKALMETFPGVLVHCMDTRQAQDRAVFVWTLEGRHAETGNTVVLPGWHEWDLNDDLKIARCRGFYDADDLARQIAGE